MKKLIASKNDGDVKIMWHGECRLDIDAFTAVFLKVLLIFWNRQQYIPQDSFHKLVVTGDNQPFYTDYDGISYVGIIPFLLDKSILSRQMD